MHSSLTMCSSFLLFPLHLCFEATRADPLRQASFLFPRNVSIKILGLPFDFSQHSALSAFKPPRTCISVNEANQVVSFPGTKTPCIFVPPEEDLHVIQLTSSRFIARAENAVQHSAHTEKA